MTAFLIVLGLVIALLLAGVVAGLCALVATVHKALDGNPIRVEVNADITDPDAVAERIRAYLEHNHRKDRTS